MEKVFYILVLLISSFVLPAEAFALECSANNYTVVYVNGILTSEDEAKSDKKDLETDFKKITNIGSKNGKNCKTRRKNARRNKGWWRK